MHLIVQVLSETRMDAETNTLHLTDGNGNEIEYELGESGEIVSLVDSGRQRYGARYTDTAGVEELSNPDGTQLVVHYGSDGHISGLTNPDMSEILFSYDTDDNLVSFSKRYMVYLNASIFTADTMQCINVPQNFSLLYFTQIFINL